MKEKFFDINELYVGCLGYVRYLGMNKGAEWLKKASDPYIIYRNHSSETLDNCHEGIDIFSNNKYYFFNEVSRKNSILEIVNGKYIIGKSVPLSVVCGNREKKSIMALKSIICNFNITDALIKNREDFYLAMLKSCLDEIDLMSEGKVKEYYINNISFLIAAYTDIIMNNSHDKEEYDSLINSIMTMRYELDREKGINVKKVKKIK